MKSKRIISLILTVLMLASIISAFAVAHAEVVSGACGEALSWSLDTDSGVFSITGTGPMDTFEDGAPWDEHKGDIRSVVTGNGVTAISDGAFAGCTSLTEVTFGDGLASIGENAFMFCIALSDVNLSGNVKTIGENAFSYCMTLSSIGEASGVECVGSGAFESTLWYNMQPDGVIYVGKAVYKCKGSVSGDVVVRDGTVSITDRAFENCTGLTGVFLPDSVRSIGASAFSNCTGLTEIALPDGITRVNGWTFYGCTDLAKIRLPESVVSVGDSAFHNTAWFNGQPDGPVCLGNILCGFNGEKPKTVTVKDGVRCIADNAFFLCENLTKVTLPVSVEEIGESAFDHCSALKDVYYAGGSEDWEKICIGANNDPLNDAVIHYNSGAVGDEGSFVFPKLPEIDLLKYFKDLREKAWYIDAAVYTIKHGLLAGFDGYFDPEGNMTRAMFVAVLARLSGAGTDNNVATVFSDVPSGQWYTGAVKWASDNGIVVGYDGKFMPTDAITREQICTILVKYAEYKGIPLTPQQALTKFKDSEKISKWAKNAVEICQKAGLIVGYDGKFDPQATATRAAVAQVIMNFVKKFIG